MCCWMRRASSSSRRPAGIGWWFGKYSMCCQYSNSSNLPAPKVPISEDFEVTEFNEGLTEMFAMLNAEVKWKDQIINNAIVYPEQTAIGDVHHIVGPMTTMEFEDDFHIGSWDLVVLCPAFEGLYETFGFRELQGVVKVLFSEVPEFSVTEEIGLSFWLNV